MYPILIVIAIIVSILLVFVVLIQNSKGGGLAANFASGNQIFGVRQTADTLEKATWYLSISLGVLCILATAFPPTQRGANGVSESAVQRSNELFQNPAAQPGFAGETTPSTEQDLQQIIQQQQQQQQQQPQQTTETPAE
ncbi:MAG: preprotein translocase subunit SecG [Prevotellaceae bacterium]|jgi:preprotein translocase subunit SecG|nr:preprotein translocase subunit SecG [Prevotellaceae bacterium]